MPKVKKSAPRKVKTLIAEPNWEKFSKAKTEEKQIDAYNAVTDFTHYEVSEKEQVASLKKWIRKVSGWDLHEETKILPDVYMTSFAKYGYIQEKLGFMPTKVYDSLNSNLKPLLLRANELREAMGTEPLTHPSLADLDDDHFLSEKKVREWLEVWKKYVSANKKDHESKDPDRRLALQSAETYVLNMRTYLKTGVWNDLFYGENREHKIKFVCTSPAYDLDGMIKRTPGTFYPDIGQTWTKEFEI